MWCVKAKMDGHAAFILTLCSFSLLFMDMCPWWVAGLCIGMNLLMLAFHNFSSKATKESSSLLTEKPEKPLAESPADIDSGSDTKIDSDTKSDTKIAFLGDVDSDVASQEDNQDEPETLDNLFKADAAEAQPEEFKKAMSNMFGGNVVVEM